MYYIDKTKTSTILCLQISMDINHLGVVCIDNRKNFYKKDLMAIQVLKIKKCKLQSQVHKHIHFIP